MNVTFLYRGAQTYLYHGYVHMAENDSIRDKNSCSKFYSEVFPDLQVNLD